MLELTGNYIVNHKMEDDENLIPKIVKESFNLLKASYGYSFFRMSNFIPMIRTISGMKLDSITMEESWNNEYLAELLDIQYSYLNDEDVDLSEIVRKFFKRCYISKVEKQVLIKDEIEKRLWSILIITTNPSHELYNLKNKQNEEND